MTDEQRQEWTRQIINPMMLASTPDILQLGVKMNVIEESYPGTFPALAASIIDNIKG